jgi:hypothetical protein
LRSRLLLGKQHMQKRRRFKHEKTFQERLAEDAHRFRAAAQALPPSTAQETLLRRARQAETALQLNDWLRSPGLQPPKALKSLVSDQKK